MRPLLATSRASTIELIERRILQRLTQAVGDVGQLDSEQVISMCEQARASQKWFRSMLDVEPGLRYEASLDPWQREAIEAMDPAWAYCVGASDKKPQQQCFYLERPRGHSKTTDVAIGTIWAIMAAPRLCRGYALAADEDQAKLIMEAAAKILELNEWLKEEIATTSTKITSRVTGAECQVVAANPGGAYGKDAAFIICDELTVWKHKGLFDAMFSGLPKRPRAMMVVITNAGYGKGTSWQWKRREKCRLSDWWWFQTLDGPQASWQSQDKIDQMREELDDEEFRRLWLNVWLAGSEAGIDYKWIVDCTTLLGPCGAGGGHQYEQVIGGLDIGLKNDRTSLVWIGVDQANRRLDLLGHRTWYPRNFAAGEVQLSEVGAVISEDIRCIGNVSALHADSWNAAMLLQSLEGSGVPCYEVQFSGGTVSRRLGTDFVAAFRNRRLRLYHDQELERDIVSIEVKYGEQNRRCQLTAPRTEEFGHADSGFALAIAVMIGTMELEKTGSGNNTGHGGQDFAEIIELS